jgi:hypothetical protein
MINTYTFAQKPCKCAFKKKVPKDTPFHLYSPETEIVVVSYKDVYDITEIIEENGNRSAYTELQRVSIEIKDNKHIIPAIQDSIILNTSQKEQLFKILHLYQVVRGNTSSTYNCYQPHHLILFYQNRQIVAFLEVCFLCYGNRASEEILENLFYCSKKYDLLKDFFKKIGIKHHLEDE